MYCIYCGKEIPDGTSFCIHCGKKQIVEDQPDAETYDKEENQTIPSGVQIRQQTVSNLAEQSSSKERKECPPGKKKHGIIYWAIQIVAIFLVIACVWYELTGQDEPQSTGLLENIEQNSDDNTIYVDEQVVPVAEYFSNPVNFMNQYQGMRIAFDFTSMPESIDSEKVTFHVIADDYDNFFLWCYSDPATIASINTNNYYAIVGTVETNNEWSLSMVDCEFIVAN